MFEDISEEDEPSFHDTIECFSEPDAGSENMHFKRRTRLPDPAEKEKGVSLWSMIKDNVGKDLSRVCLPVYFNEPISSLQKCFEDLEYSYLLDQAYEYGKSVSDLKDTLKYVEYFTYCYVLFTSFWKCKRFLYSRLEYIPLNLLELTSQLVRLTVLFIIRGTVSLEPCMLLRLRSLVMLPLKAGTVNLSTPCWEKLMKPTFQKKEFVSSLKR